MLRAINKVAELFASAVLDLEATVLPAVGWLDLENQPTFIDKSVVSLLPGELYETHQIGYLHQSGPRLFLMTKHPEITFAEALVFDSTGNRVEILESIKYPAGYLFNLASSSVVSELRLHQVSFPNPAFVHYSNLLMPLTEYLNNTLYWTNFRKFAKTITAIKKLLTVNQIYTKEVLADYLNLLLGLPFVDQEGYISSIEEAQDKVRITLLNDAQEPAQYEFDKPGDCKVVLKPWQEVNGYERVFDVVEIL